MVCASGKMVCASWQNGLRSWQNGLRAISDVTDVLEKMICALICAWFALDLRAIGWGARSAAQIIFNLMKCTPQGALDGTQQTHHGHWLSQRGGLARWPRDLAGGTGGVTRCRSMTHERED